MKRIVFIFFIIVNCQLSVVNCAFAQETYIERLQRPVPGQGRVIIFNDAEIAALVSGRASRTGNRVGQNVSSSVTHLPDTLLHDTLTFTQVGRKVRMNGYRVQVYAGGNSREAKRRAYQVEGQVKSLFPGQPVYTRFVEPRWLCHVGDFQTREEALELLGDLRKTGRFPEAITVKCKINAYVYDE